MGPTSQAQRPIAHQIKVYNFNHTFKDTTNGYSTYSGGISEKVS